MDAPVPTLSMQGWVTDPAGKLDFALSHFFLSEANQTNLYPGHVYSFPQLVQQCGGEASQLISLLQDALQNYLKSYYSYAQVEVTPDTDLNIDPALRVSVTAKITIGDNGSFGTYNRFFKTENSKLVQWVRLNNG